MDPVQPDADFIPAASKALYTLPRPMLSGETGLRHQDGGRARLRQGRVEVQEPRRPQPRLAPVTLGQMLAQVETVPGNSLD